MKSRPFFFNLYRKYDLMETNSTSRRYETRRNARAKEPVTKSRVDWNRTKRTGLFDSEEEDDEITSTSEKESQTSSEDEAEEKGESVVSKSKEETTVNGGSVPVVEAGCGGTAEEDVEEETVVPGKLKRRFVKHSPAEQERRTTPAEETKRKQQRLMKLQELSQRRSTRTRSDRSHHEDVEEVLEDAYPSSLSPSEISDSADEDSMKDFIVEEEEGKEGEREESQDDESQPQEKKYSMSSETLLQHYIPGLYHVDPSVHLERIVRAFLINVVDDNFLISLYEGVRQKKYAQEMLTSLHYLDDRFIQPRLNNLLARSRWKERYKERVDTYPDMYIIYGDSERRACQACELQRYCTLTVVLSGKSYDSNTMETDDFMSHDKQRLKVGSVCGSRTEVYHNLKHFKYKLYKDCCCVMKNDGVQDEPLKDTVVRVFSRLEEDGWIQKVKWN
uniref:Uncharacterized protein n=1 Tax=Sphaerodactylus townsendi TaxID=933632 RepID=A0ACB8FGE0_9SAUR